MLFQFMLLTEKDQKVLNSYEMLLLSEKLFQKYKPAALMIQIVNIDKSEDASVFILVGKSESRLRLTVDVVERYLAYLGQIKKSKPS